MPPDFVYLWNIFVELHTARGAGGFGPNAISYSEILAYCQMTGWTLSPWEVKVVRSLDNVFLETASQSE